MKTIIILFLTILLFSASCKSNVSVEKKNVFALVKTKMDLKNISHSCKAYLQKDLRKMWMFNEKGNCYYDSKKIRQALINNEHCFKELSSHQLKTVLGTPSHVFQVKKINAKSLNYYLGKKCGKDYPYWKMQFIYNEKDSLLRIGVDQITIQ